MTMREKIARAAEASLNRALKAMESPPTRIAVSPGGALVDAILDAMHEPTDAMIEEGAGVIPCGQGAEEGPSNMTGARDCWMEMIAAAKEEC